MTFLYTKARNLGLCSEKRYFLDTKVVSIGFAFKKREILTITRSGFDEISRLFKI